MGESYQDIRKELEEAIASIATFEAELGADEETVQPIKLLVEGMHSPFCLVVLGEKGSGKSCLLNAFIRYELSQTGFMEDRIRVYRHGKEESDHLIAEDLEECCRPLDFLKRFTLIDTPANLLLGDARLLTRDIFPIADLVLCVFSVNNPWAPSTWEFLRNVRKEWLSKVAFVVQQADLGGEELSRSVCDSLASHAEQCLGVRPALFPISAKLAMIEDSRTASGIQALEQFIDEKTAASQAHYVKARSTCQAARGALIDLAERVRGTLYLAGIESGKIKELMEIMDGCKQRSYQEIRQIIQTVTDSYKRSQTQGEEILKAKLSLIQSLKSAFAPSDFSLPFQEGLEKQLQTEIANAAEAIKVDLLAGSQRFLESTIFSKEEDQVSVSDSLAKNGRELGDQIKKALSRNRSEGVDEILHDLLDGAGKSIRVPAMAAAAGLFLTLLTYFAASPTVFGVSAAISSILLAVTVILVSQKHTVIMNEFHNQVSQKRERALNTIERQLKEAVDGFANKHLALLPQSTFAKSARLRLEPYLPKVKALENSFSDIDAKLSKLLAEAQ